MINNGMKVLLCIISIGLSLSPTFNDQDYSLKIEKGKIVKQFGGTYWIIPTTLINNTKDTLKYFSMSCSWQDFYPVDNKKLEKAIVDCQRNFSIILTLAPHQTAKVDLRLLVIEPKDAGPVSFKIGFNLMEAKSFRDRLDYEEAAKMKNVIWSNVISM